MEEEKFVTREEMGRLENELKEVKVRLDEWKKFWRERVVYISIYYTHPII
jgi:hypothetical protein